MEKFKKYSKDELENNFWSYSETSAVLIDNESTFDKNGKFEYINQQMMDFQNFEELDT